MTEKKMFLVCRHCGSENLVFDCSAWWDSDKQQWDYGEPYDKSEICNDCGGETRAEELHMTDDEYTAHKTKRRLTQ